MKDAPTWLWILALFMTIGALALIGIIWAAFLDGLLKWLFNRKR